MKLVQLSGVSSVGQLRWIKVSELSELSVSISEMTLSLFSWELVCVSSMRSQEFTKRDWESGSHTAREAAF